MSRLCDNCFKKESEYWCDCLRGNVCNNCYDGHRECYLNDCKVFPKPTEEEMEEAIDIFGREEWNKMIERGGSILDYMVESSGSISYASAVCEICEKRFRLWRKNQHIYAPRKEKWYEICKHCYNTYRDDFR